MRFLERTRRSLPSSGNDPGSTSLFCITLQPPWSSGHLLLVLQVPIHYLTPCLGIWVWPSWQHLYSHTLLLPSPSPCWILVFPRECAHGEWGRHNFCIKALKKWSNGRLNGESYDCLRSVSPKPQDPWKMPQVCAWKNWMDQRNHLNHRHIWTSAKHWVNSVSQSKCVCSAESEIIFLKALPPLSSKQVA